MSDEDPGTERLGALADAFLARRRAGEPLTVSAYAAEHPADAPRIVALFPTLAVLDEHAALIPDLDAEPEPDAPRELGAYVLRRELGRGGMGIVYEAEDRALGRRVAVKVLSGWSLRDERARERFRREARIVGRLRHPGIVPIHALDEADGVVFFVMDRIDGTGLDELVAGGGSAQARWAAGLGVQAAEALAYAHGQGVLHRDVKPSNFLLDGDGRLWLADFGLAKIVGDEGLTATGEWLGTLRYTAPECLRGRADARSDLYSLGLTLYELLVGVPAFPGSDRIELVRRVIEGDFPPPGRVDASIPADLEAIVLKAAAHAPEDRYPDADALAQDLRRFLDGHPVLARPRTRRRRKLARLLVPLVVVAALVALAALRGRDGGAGTGAAPEPTAPVAVTPGPPVPVGRPDRPPPWAGWRRGLGGAGAGAGRRGPGRGLGPPALRPQE
jgi:predicted Ser/Thr protein kinase